MTPSQQAKQAGCTGLAQVSETVGISPQTLTNWHKNRPEVFQAVIEYTARRASNADTGTR